MIAMLLAFACSDPVAVAEPAPALPAKVEAPPAAKSSAIVLDGPRPRNVLMISIDTIRRDHVSRYGNRASTPFLDRLFAEGIALDRHRSCSNWTLAAVACVLSGKDHIAMQFLPEITLRGPQPAPPGIDFLDEILERRGFYTGRVTSNNFLDADYGVGSPDDLVFEHRGRGETITSRGLEVLDRAVASKKPWFVHLHYLDPHSPYYKPGERRPEEGTFDYYAQNPRFLRSAWDTWSEDQKEKLKAATRERYKGEVELTDQILARLWTTLEQKRLLDNTLVVVWSDHGEQFWERGRVSHGYDLNAEEADALGAFWAKGLRPVAFRGLTVHEDIPPTILSILGFDSDIEKAKMTGLVVGTGPADRATFAEDFSGQNSKMSVDKGTKRLIYNWEGRLSYYDLATDPGETRDLLAGMARTDPDAPDFPADARALWKILAARVAPLDTMYAGITPVLPGKDPTAEQRAAPRDQRQRGADEMAQGSSESRGKAGGSGTRRRTY